jgi:hypothetical protein
MPRFVGAFAFALFLAALTGCVNPITRAQMAEDNEKVRDVTLVRVLSDVADVSGVTPQQVHGVGLVTGLAGTGHTPNGFYRDLLEQYLLKHLGPKGGEIPTDTHRTSVRRILENPDNAMVIVTGYLPAGVRKGDHFDVEISLPPDSKCISLAGGTLQVCALRVYEAKANLSERFSNSREMLSGHVLAMAKGPLIVGFGKNTDVNELKSARVWQGGTSRINRAYSFLMKDDIKSVRIANELANRINTTYQDDPHSTALLSDQQKRILMLDSLEQGLNNRRDPAGFNQSEMAKAVGKNVINARVPFAYRFNHERYLLVACKTPLVNNDPGVPKYKQRLAKMLLDPRDTLSAAVRLEALGRESIAILQTGLDSEHPFVRFAAAEALAYLGNTSGVETLAKLAQEHPMLVYHATLALAGLGEAICKERLADLMGSDQPALRCAAFHCLTLIDETDPRLGQIPFTDQFRLYRHAQAPNATVYYATGKRPQVIIFGKNITLASETSMMVGRDYTVKMDAKTGQCLVKRITLDGERKVACSNRLDEVLIALTDLGATYPDIVDFLRRANEYQFVSCPVANWTTPTVTLEMLTEAGKNLK